MVSPSKTSRRDFLTQSSGVLAVAALADASDAAGDAAPKSMFEPVKIPEWVFDVTRMAFLSPGEVSKAAKAGVQVVHTNLIWPYFPLHRDGGGLSKEDDRRLRELVGECHRQNMNLVLGLPPFPPVTLVKKHPDWRVHPTDSDAAVKVVPVENNLGTRLGCNLGPWGDYLIEVCGELVGDYRIDGFSFDGNYHSPICYCPACKTAYRRDRKGELPLKVNLDDITYREYLLWRGERLEDHYRRLQRSIKEANANAVLMSWTVNAGRYGHFLHSPRAMPARLNRLFDLPMQEWWLDETNFGGSIAPAFGAAYLRAVSGGRPCASEPYLMSRGNPYGTDSFPAQERLTRCLLAATNGNVLAESFGWAGHDVAADFQEIARRQRYLTRAEALPWAALLVSEQTRQFYAYKDIANRFLPHVFGAFRAATEEHLPLTLLNDWDMDTKQLARYEVVVLANAAALSDDQAAALRAYVRAGGGLVATGETSLCDELGRPRRDFALAELFGVSYQGRPRREQTAEARRELRRGSRRNLLATTQRRRHPELDGPSSGARCAFATTRSAKFRDVPRPAGIGKRAKTGDGGCAAHEAGRMESSAASSRYLTDIWDGSCCLFPRRHRCGSMELRLSLSTASVRSGHRMGGAPTCSDRGEGAPVRPGDVFHADG